jgi:3-mercaptopyruvate sulfurtransferase SseA
MTRCEWVSVRDAEHESLVDVDWVAAHVGDPRVRLVEVDVSRAAYDGGHIPGAVLWNAYTDLRDAGYRPVPAAELTLLLSRSGVTPETTVVFYGYGAPLGFWLLKAFGHDDVRMLMGSREQWAQAGHDWSMVVPEPVEGVYTPAVADAARHAHADRDQAWSSRERRLALSPGVTDLVERCDPRPRQHPHDVGMARPVDSATAARPARKAHSSRDAGRAPWSLSAQPRSVDALDGGRRR